MFYPNTKTFSNVRIPNGKYGKDIKNSTEIRELNFISLHYLYNYTILRQKCLSNKYTN